MKKAFAFLIISMAVTTLTAQVQLEHTYSLSGTLTEIDNGEFKYFVQDIPLAQCRILNEDHTPFKTINLDVPGGYNLYDTKFVTRHLFNTDDYIEVLYVYNKTTIIGLETVYQYGMKIVNELGNELMDLDNGGYAEVKKGSEGSMLLAYQYIPFDGYYLVYTNVYSLGGTTKAATVKDESVFNIYPNPASEMVTITMNPWEKINHGQVMITDMSGRLLNKEPIAPGENMTRIQTDWMSPGTYVMTLMSNEKIIASEKIEIK